MRPIAILRMKKAVTASYDTVSVAYFAAMTAQPDATRKGLIDTLIRGLRTDGLLAIGDVLHLIASHDAQSASLNALNPAIATITLSGTPTFTADRGYLTDGSTNFLDTNRANNAGGNHTQNSMSFGFYVNAGIAASSASSLAGAFQAAPAQGTSVNPWSAANTSTWRANSASANIITAAASPNNALGSSIVSRVSNTDWRAFRNGAQVGATSALASATQVTTTYKYGAITAAASRAGQFGYGWLGGGLTPTQAANLHSRLLTYLTAIGAN